jgi:hypothetical protein
MKHCWIRGGGAWLIALVLASMGCEPADGDTETSPISALTTDGRPTATGPTASRPAADAPVASSGQGAMTSTAPPGGPDSVASSPSALASDDAPREVTFDDLKFVMDKTKETFRREMLGATIEALMGRTIRLRGYILPTYQQSGITQFVLVRDNQECCFGGNAALHDCVIVDMAPGASANYTVRPVAVEGTFGLRELAGPDGRTLAIYHLTGRKVE